MNQITLPYPPGNNHLHSVFRGRKIKSKAAREYSNTVALIAGRMKPLDGPVQIYIDLYRPQRSGDLDGRFKAVLDGLKGFAFHDDKQITGIVAYRHEDKANPRVVVGVRSAPDESFAMNHGDIDGPITDVVSRSQQKRVKVLSDESVQTRCEPIDATRRRKP